MAEPDVAIVIPALDEADTIEALLDDCAAQQPPPAEVVVVDAGSTDATPALLADRARLWPLLRVVHAPGAKPGAARNAGIEGVSAAAVATVDAGSRVAADWLASLRAELGPEPDRRVVVGSSRADASTPFEQAVGWLTLRGSQARTSQGLVTPTRPAGRNGFLFTKSAWRAAGGYPPELAWGEDKIFLERLRANGVEFVAAPRGEVRWRPRGSIRAVLKQYAGYGRGDAIARIDRKNELVPLALYATGVALAAAAALGSGLAALALLLGVAGYFGGHVLAAARELRSARAIAWVAPVRAAADLGKIGGFLWATVRREGA